ncbi:MAG: hypothetical protein A2054_04455 [Deltaproteobacteria bacterium GWA2_55_10]|nr:MAG: hypothetical protein A2054_04455 [Deltaproteobacteria bacterium GWA2_55_10]
MNDLIVEYRIDRSDIFIDLNDYWTVFAVENKAPELTPDAVLDRPLWDFIKDRETRHLYRLILMEARYSLSTLKFPFRCDSPGLRRFHEMEVTSSADGSVRFRCTTLRTEARSPAMLLDRDADRSGEYVTICSWCRRVRMPEGDWAEIDEAVMMLDLLGSQRPPGITHGICPDDHKIVMNGIEISREKRRKAA